MEYSIYTTRKNKKDKLLKYFEKDTQKWKLLHWLSGDLNSKPIIKGGANFCLDQIINFLNETKRCDVAFLMNHFKRSHPVVMSNLKILQNQNKINLSKKPKSLHGRISDKASVFLKEKKT